MSESNPSAFRRPADRISSPEQLTDFLRVTKPGVWVILTAVILLLCGIAAWASIGTLKTNTPAWAVVENHRAQVVAEGSARLEAGMPLEIGGENYTIAAVEEDELLRSVGIAEVPLPDGVFECTVVTEEIHPITFLLKAW